MCFTDYNGEVRSEAFIRRTLQIIYNKLLQGKITLSVANSFIPKLFDRLQTLIDLRYNSEACINLMLQSKGQQTLFVTVGLYSIHIASFLINPIQFKARIAVSF